MADYRPLDNSSLLEYKDNTLLDRFFKSINDMQKEIKYPFRTTGGPQEWDIYLERISNLSARITGLTQQIQARIALGFSPMMYGDLQQHALDNHTD